MKTSSFLLWKPHDVSIMVELQTLPVRAVVPQNSPLVYSPASPWTCKSMQVAVPCPSLCSCRNGACGSVIVDVTEVGCIPQTYPMSKGFFFFFFYGSPSNVLHLKSLHNRWYCARKKIDSSWDMEIGVQNTLYPYRPTRDTSMMSRMLQNCIFNWIASLAAQFPPCSLKDKRSDHQNTSKDGGDKEWVADGCASVYLSILKFEIW